MKTRCCLIALGILGLDQLTKWLAVRELAGGRGVELIPGYLGLSYVENTGVAFGLFDGVASPWKPWILGGLALVAVAVILLYGLYAPKERRLLHLALAVTLGGVAGNLVDRVARGFVVDFVEFHIRQSFYWPNFNVADSAITVGVVLLLFDSLRNPAAGKPSGPPRGGER
ncbi:MAG: signal peptidase II [Acidobacteria bacterium]|nr:signal peptidase II [Acidobacteriota bacterium]